MREEEGDALVGWLALVHGDDVGVAESASSRFMSLKHRKYERISKAGYRYGDAASACSVLQHYFASLTRRAYLEGVQIRAGAHCICGKHPRLLILLLRNFLDFFRHGAEEFR